VGTERRDAFNILMKPRTLNLELERQRMIGALRELVAALDRRMPGVAGDGERQIAFDSAALKRKALARLKTLLDAPCARR